MQELKKQAGFTLIELMIVVAIIGILAAIAIPSYVDYQNKARASEMLIAMSPGKAAVSEYIVMKNGSLPTTTDQAGVGNMQTANISSVGWTSNSIRAVGQAALADLTLILTPTWNSTGKYVSWACTSTGSNAKIAPASCR
jgi:type IV pilus assembly protein PilA